jgi:transaldolase
VREICEVVPGPVSAEVTATDTPTMLAEGRKLAKLAKNVTVKVPLTPNGLKACKALSSEGTMVNVTLCFSAAQAILAAKAGASFVSPFVGRLDDIGATGMDLIGEIVEIYRQYPYFKTEVLVASVRTQLHVVEAAKLGAHVATIPPAVLRQMFAHPLTDKGLQAFLADWAKTGQSILGEPKKQAAE